MELVKLNIFNSLHSLRHLYQNMILLYNLYRTQKQYDHHINKLNPYKIKN